MNTQRQDDQASVRIDTAGGTFVEGDVQTGGGEFVGRDKITYNVNSFIERALTAAEAAEQGRQFEAQHLAEGVSAFAQRLQAVASADDVTRAGGPYKGLLAYQLRDADLFFGRDEAIRSLLHKLQRGPLTILHAESGAGKTSLLQAGISPRLITQGHLPVYSRPYNRNPSLALEQIFIPNLNDVPGLQAAPLRDFLGQVSSVLGTNVTIYLLLDQFEEFFTHLDEPERSAFVNELAECLDDAGLNVRWVLALRTEFFGELATFRPRIQDPFASDYRLNHLTQAEAQAALTQPAARHGVTFEAGLIETLLDDLGRDEVSPPQLQLVCATLFERRPPGESEIGRELYDAVGGAAGILQGHLERVLSRDLQAEQRRPARLLIEALITFDSRRLMRSYSDLAAELQPRGVPPRVLADILHQLVNSRLLRVQEEDPPGVEPVYELAHDYLLAEIQLDPAVKARKQAEELLAQGMDNWQRLRTLLGPDALALIEAQREVLRLTDEAARLLLRSAVAHRRPPAHWVRQLSPPARQQLVAALASERREGDRRTRRQALAVLWALRAYVPHSLAWPVYAWRVLSWGRRPLVTLLLLLVLGPATIFAAVKLSEPADTGWQVMDPFNGTPAGVTRGVSAVAANPDDADDVYVVGPGGQGLYVYQRTADGLAWIELDDAGWHNWPIHTVTVAGRTVYIVTPGGVFVSQDEGDSWQPAAPLPERQPDQRPQVIAANPRDPDHLYVGVRGAGILSTTNGGQSWAWLETPPQMRDASVEALVTNGRIVVAATAAGLWIGEQSPLRWEQVHFEGCDLPEEWTVLALTMPNPGPGSNSLLAALEGQGEGYGICDGNVADGKWFQLAPDPPARLIHSVAAVGENYYAGSDVGLLCRRVWHWREIEWWLWRLSRPVPCSGERR